MKIYIFHHYKGGKNTMTEFYVNSWKLEQQTWKFPLESEPYKTSLCLDWSWDEVGIVELFQNIFIFLIQSWN